jgi:hypothetical protein
VGEAREGRVSSLMEFITNHSVTRRKGKTEKGMVSKQRRRKGTEDERENLKKKH